MTIKEKEERVVQQLDKEIDRGVPHLDKTEKKLRNFVPDSLGSATVVQLDGKSEFEGHVGEQNVLGNKEQNDFSDEYSTKGAPWGYRESLKEMCNELGMDFDQYIDKLDREWSDEEIAAEFDIPVKSASYLREHFMKYGIDSVMGQD